RRQREDTVARPLDHLVDHRLERQGDMRRGDLEEGMRQLVGLPLTEERADQHGHEDQEGEDREDAGEGDIPGKGVAIVAPVAVERLTEDSPDEPAPAAPLAHGKSGAASRPRVSGRPSMRLAFWSACPEEPLTRLSRAAKTIARPGRRSATTPRCT